MTAMQQRWGVSSDFAAEGSIPGTDPSLERHDKRAWTSLAFRYFCDPIARR